MNDSRIQLSASLEDYLEAILQVVLDKGAARVKDIVKRLGVKAASVTKALRQLSELEYIHYTPYEVITLTASGMEEARKILRRHEILNDFFTRILWIDADLAEKAACHLEHGIPALIVDRLVAFTEFAQSCPRAGEDWIDQFARHCLEGRKLECPTCLSKCYDRFQTQQDKNDRERLVRLDQLQPGQRCMVRGIRHKAAVTKRLVEMGIGRGAVIEVERLAPLGDPMEIKVKGYHLSLRLDEAKYIDVVEQ